MINNDLQFNYYGIIGNELIENECIDSNISSVYSVLRTIFYDMSKEVAVFNLYSLYEAYRATSTTQRNPIKQAIQYLISEKYIELYSFIEVDVADFNSSNLSQMYRCEFINDNKQERDTILNNFHQNGFTKISCLNMHNILSFLKSNESNIHKHKLIKYYLYIARRCSNSDLIGYVSMDTINKAIKISGHTCTEYNSILEDEVGAIFYNNDYGKIDSKGNFKMSTTIFGHKNITKANSDNPLSHDEFIRYLEYYSTKNNVVQINKTEITNKRSESMKKIWEERRMINND